MEMPQTEKDKHKTNLQIALVILFFTVASITLKLTGIFSIGNIPVLFEIIFAIALIIYAIYLKIKIKKATF